MFIQRSRYTACRFQRSIVSLSLTLLFLQACDTSGSGTDQSDIQRIDVPDVEYSDEFLQPVENAFAESFSEETLYYRTRRADDSDGEASAIVDDGAVVLRAESDTPDYVARYMRVGNGANRVLVNAQFDPDTVLPPDSGAIALTRLNADLFNILADGGTGGENPFVGNVNIDVGVGLSGFGQSHVFVCMGSYGVEGYVPLAFTADGTNCWDFPDSENLQVGEAFAFGYEFDKAGRQLIVMFNEQQTVFDLPGGVFEAYGNREVGIQLAQVDGPGTAVARIRGVTLDERDYDFSQRTVVLDQLEMRTDGALGDPEPAVRNEQLQFRVTSADGEYREQSLQHVTPSNYLESTITLSSESLLNRGRVQARLDSLVFNDLAPDNRNGRTGDVRASIELNARADGTREAEVCLVRSTDADFDNREGLLDGGERRCRSLPMRVELDTPYRVAIAFDQAGSQVVFRINGLSVVEPVSTAMYEPSEPSARIVINANQGATVVASVDDVRTAPSALTDNDIEAGRQSPPDFPEPPIVVVADSAVLPAFNRDQRLGFIDDFSQDSRQIAYHEDTDRGVSGIEYVDGGIELRTSVYPEFADRGSYSEIYINGETQALVAKVSLSSESSLPPYPDARSEIRLQGHLFRDNQDYAPDDRTGDIFTSISLRTRGDGRGRISYYVSRRVEGADDERLTILDGEDGGFFDDIDLELDRVYEMGIKLDTERNVLMFSVDDTVREFQLPWPTYKPARGDAIVQVQHEGSSGKAVGTVYSVETDSVSENFMASLPLMGPYRPAFNARYQSQSVDVSDGQLRLTSDTRVSDGRPSRLIALGTSAYVGADMTLSSESVVAADESGDGLVVARLGGLMYRAISVEDIEDSTGKVYAAISLVQNIQGEVFAEYCAFQSTEADFRESDELIGGDSDNCPRFAQAIQLNTPYSASIQFDEDARTLTFSVGAERKVYDIQEFQQPVEDGFQGPQARAMGLSKAVVLVDNLAFSATPVPLALSPQRLVSDSSL